MYNVLIRPFRALKLGRPKHISSLLENTDRHTQKNKEIAVMSSSSAGFLSGLARMSPINWIETEYISIPK